MGAKLKDMGIVKQILRLSHQGQSIKAIMRLTGVSKNTVRKYIRLSQVSDHSLEDLLSWEEARLEEFFTIKGDHSSPGRQKELEELFPHFQQELKRPGVTRWVLWGEYRQSYPKGLGYSQFCNLLYQYSKQNQCSFHVDPIAGDKMFIDYAGKKLSIVDKSTGEITQVEVLVALLGYSQLTYVEATYTQTKEDLIGGCVNALHFFGGSPKALVCDNLKSAVHKASKYEPCINETFNDFANHYRMAVLPTRSRKPKDKATVERAVSIVYNRIYAPLRNRTFFSLKELNAAIGEALLLHNQHLLQNKEDSRQSLFEQSEKMLLQQIPAEIYELKQYKELTVMKNAHIQLREDFHYYSAPYRYIGQRVKVIYTRTQVSLYLHGERIAFHLRNCSRHKYTTIKEHLPSHHQFMSDWNPDRFLDWAAGIDPVVKEYIGKILESKTHPEQAYKSCTGILSMGRKTSKEDLIAACRKAHGLEVYSYIFIKRIIANGFARQDPDPSQAFLPFHDNIRGPQYYQ